eukprot:Colp12_sorted_trinity150504_noHs@25596
MSKPNQTPAPLPFYQQFIAGGIAGVTEILVMYPTDVVKTRQQISTGKSAGMISTLVTLIKNDGFGIYRGILPPIIVEAPKRAIKFAANEQYKNLFKRNGKLDQAGAIASGVCAGCTEATVIVPFELVKIRLQDPANKALYTSTMDCVRQILKAEGVLAFYNGLEATLWRHALWNGGYFGVIHVVKNILPEAKDETGNTLRNFTAGAIAGTFGTILNTPSDVVKSRIQNQPRKHGVTPKYNWTLPAIATIAKEEGIAALYRGFIPKVVRLGPGGGILLVVFEKVSQFFREYNARQ